MTPRARLKTKLGVELAKNRGRSPTKEKATLFMCEVLDGMDPNSEYCKLADALEKKSNLGRLFTEVWNEVQRGMY